jgi:hypothetical protein
MLTQTTLGNSTISRRAGQRCLRSLARCLLGCLAMLLVAGCGGQEKAPPPTPYDFELNVLVQDEKQNPVVKAPVVLDGKTVGYTDKDGVFKAVLSEFVGTEVTVSIGAMDAYLVPETARTTAILKRVKTLKGNTSTPVLLQATLQSVRNDYLVWIDVDCAEAVDSKHCQNLPVSHDGEVVARTDMHGRAHFNFKGVPDQTIKVSIDTPVYEPSEGDEEDDAFDLHPADPTYEISLGLGSEVLLVKETLTDPKAAERLAEVKADRAAARRRRARRRARKRAKERKRKEKAAGVIDLW